MPPAPDWDIYIGEDGGRELRSDDPARQGAFGQWNIDACEHECGWALHHRLGSIGEVALLRSALARQADAFPLILSKVLYSGIHAGDIIPVEHVALLEPELRSLADLHGDDSRSEEYVRHFETQLRELVETARRIGKPISF